MNSKPLSHVLFVSTSSLLPSKPFPVSTLFAHSVSKSCFPLLHLQVWDPRHVQCVEQRSRPQKKDQRQETTTFFTLNSIDSNRCNQPKKKKEKKRKINILNLSTIPLIESNIPSVHNTQQKSQRCIVRNVMSPCVHIVWCLEITKVMISSSLLKSSNKRRIKLYP